MSELNADMLHADDPGLTAYALGELEGTEAEHYAERLRQSVELQLLVQEIQAEAKLLTEELRLEPAMPLTPERRASIVAQAVSESPNRAVVARKRPGSPWLAWMSIAASTAAVGAVVAISLPRARNQNVAFDSKRTIERKLGDVANKEERTDKIAATLSPLTRDPHSTSPSPPGSPTFQSTHREADASEVRHSTGSLTIANATPAAPGKYSEDRAPTNRSTFESEKQESIPSPNSGAAASFAKVPSDPRDESRPASSDSKGSEVGDSSPRKHASPTSDLEKQGSKSDFSSVQDSKGEHGQGDQRNGQKQASGDNSSGKPGMNELKRGKSSGRGNEFSAEGEASSQVDGLATITATTENKPRGDGKPAVGGPQGSNPSGARRELQGQEQSKTSPEPDSNRFESLTKKEGASDRTPAKPKLLLVDESRRKGIQENSAAKDKFSKRNLLPLGDTVQDGEASEAKSPGFKGRESRELSLAESTRGRESEIGAARGIPASDFDKLKDGYRREPRPSQTVADLTSAETYRPIYENSFVSPTREQLSTFSIDVDSASYANVRRFLQSGQVPHPDAVRIEELVNYFSYQYPTPQDGKPFSVNTDIAACPWNPGHSLVRIGLKGREIAKAQRPPSSLVFLVDVSGSMSAENKLPLVRSSLKTLVGQLDERDRIAIVTYAGEAGVRLPSTSVAQKDTILAAIDGLGAGGSTNGAAGINTAYDIAAKEFLEKGTNRVILCTDGDFNVGVTSDDALVQMIQTRAKGGVFLSIFGFGMGNLKDGKLEQLADKGNGQYGYIDDRMEAEKVFVHELSGTLVTIAKDVKIQIDFNPEAVAAYRLIGYENRALAAEDFHDDKKDAGEIGAGHTVTALYEIVAAKDFKADDKTRWMTVKLRYKQPDASTSELIENPLTGIPGQLKLASSDFQFAASVASFGMLLRNSQHAGQANWGMVKELAQSGLSHDQYGHRAGFLRLVTQAESMLGERRPPSPPEPDSTANGKYKSLLRRLNVPEDAEKYGQFNDYGFDKSKSYGGSENLPEGYWVYVAPYWYIWGETTQPAGPK